MNEQHLYWVGMDVSEASFDAAVVSPGQYANPETIRRLPAATFARDPRGVKAFVQWLRKLLPGGQPLPVRGVMEATGIYSIHLAAMLSKQFPELEPAIANPQQTSAFRDSLGLRNKTDRLDARALAFYGLSRQPDAYVPLSPAQAELRSLSRCRDTFKEQRVAHQNQIKQHPDSDLSRKLLRGQVAQLKKDMQTLEREMKRIIQSDANLRTDYRLLTSIPGVGFVTAATTLAELGDLRRFGGSRQVSATAGVTPSHSDSGQSNPPAHMSKKGNPRVRRVLYMAALSASRHNPHLSLVYNRLLKAGKEPMVALGALMRKLIVLMRAIVVSGRVYDPLWKTRPRKEPIAAKTA